MKLVRYGGLSATKDKVRYKRREDYYHSPPCKKGVYCFHPDFVEPFLWAWKKDERKDLDCKKRVFNYNGNIWTHIYVPSLDKKGYYIDKSGNWYLTHTKYIDKIFSKEISKQNKEILQIEDGCLSVKDWYFSRGMSRDAWKYHGDKDVMELFISEKV